jgi:hypothetical protein
MNNMSVCSATSQGQSAPLEEPKESGLGEWDAGDDDEEIAPRQWLLGNLFCRRFMSGLIGEGGAGKTTLRYTHLLSLATGRGLTGEHVFCRTPVLIICLEDDRDEVRRRLKAIMLHYGITRAELKGWLYVATPRGVTLADPAANGSPAIGRLEAMIREAVQRRNIGVVSLDPFVKAHGLEENNNSQIDFVAQLLANMAIELNIATDVCHHTRKGTAEAGNADAGRGAGALKDGGRLVYTVTRMTPEEAKLYGIGERERFIYIRHDSAKVNLAPPSGEAQWFKLVGVSLSNGTKEYPHGDTVQAIEQWTPPDAWAGINIALANEILTAIDKGLENGQRYSAGAAAKDRAAWKVILQYAPDKTEHQAREVIKGWIRNKVLIEEVYEDPVIRKTARGLRLDLTKRPR